MPKDTKSIEKKIIQILADKLDIDAKRIKLESKLMDDLGMDSFLAVEFNFELKENFGIDVPQEEIANIKTVKEVIEFIAKSTMEKKK